ncbi:MAG: hypothetical protein AABX08_02575 [Nanoarchaeota archaeon]
MVDLNQIKEKIISIVKTEGPLLPIQISRKLEKDTIFAGAVLSELVKQKTLLVSNGKIGSSPIYYISGQENKLSILYSHLPSKEKEAYELLRSHQILKDKDCTPPIRIALRSIKDFSIPLELNGELYWRWHLTQESEAKELLNLAKQKEPEMPTIEAKSQDKLTKYAELEQQRRDSTISSQDEFSIKVSSYFKNKNIAMLELSPIKKKREVEGKIKINSDLGPLEFFVLAKNKKKINEADLSLATDKGRKQKLPVLFLSNGEMTKKCANYLEENLKGRVVFRKIS